MDATGHARRCNYNVGIPVEGKTKKVNIIPIGNSKGIRIPKALLEQCGFGESIEIEVKGKQILLSTPVRRRDGWEKAFKAMAVRQDDALLRTPPTAFDDGEWQW